jgi:deoxycytidine triphosphate deaminase
MEPFDPELIQPASVDLRLARTFLVFGTTSGRACIDPKQPAEELWDGHLTLEISNLAPLAVALYPGMRIAQLSLMRLDSPVELPYGPARGSKYQGDVLPTASRLFRDFARPSADQRGCPG